MNKSISIANTMFSKILYARFAGGFSKNTSVAFELHSPAHYSSWAGSRGQSPRPLLLRSSETSEASAAGFSISDITALGTISILTAERHLLRGLCIVYSAQMIYWFRDLLARWATRFLRVINGSHWKWEVKCVCILSWGWRWQEVKGDAENLQHNAVVKVLIVKPTGSCSLMFTDSQIVMFSFYKAAGAITT